MATKIMLVEDDTNLSSIYQARLEAEGFQILTANDGEAALALAVKEHPELIISDVMMPKISGFDMLDILRGTDGVKDTKVIMMTALGQAEDKARAEKLGADRYLVKSQVTLEDVVQTVHEVLGDQERAAASVVAASTTPASQPTPTNDATPTTSQVTEPSAPAPSTPTEPPTAAAIPVAQPPVAAPDPVGQPLDQSSTTQPIPVAAPPADQSQSAAVGDDQTSANEQAAVLSQIQDFINTQESAAQPNQEPAAKSQTVIQPASNNDSPISKKIIAPIEPQPKTNLSELLDKEQNANTATQSNMPHTGTSIDGFITPSQPSMAGSMVQPTPLNNNIDPNKVSL